MDLEGINFSDFEVFSNTSSYQDTFHAIVICTIRLRRQKDPGRWYARVARGVYARAMSRHAFQGKYGLLLASTKFSDFCFIR